MLRNNTIICLLTLLFSIANSLADCFPQNSLNISPLEKGIRRDEAHTQSLITQFQNVFSPYLKKNYKKELIIKSDWQSSRVNASATRDDHNNPVLTIHGGLARHPDLTDDGLLLILCHELGHYLGGAPRSFRGRSNKRSWSSAEGQADYFAVTKCLPKLFTDVKKIQNFPKAELEIAQKVCPDQKCTRIALAGLSASIMFASLKDGWETPKLKHKDLTIVRETRHDHPIPQCRLDTYVSAALCDADIDLSFDPENPNVGACLSAGKDEFIPGARPFCWYHPQ